MRTILIIFIVIFCCKSSFADWPAGKKRTTLIATYTYFRSSKIYDSTGKLYSLGKGNFFVSNSINLYMVHGLARRLDLIANVPFSYITSSLNSVKTNKSGIGDCMIGLAYHIPFNFLKNYFTAKALYIFPAYQNTSQPYLGFGSHAYEFSLNYSFNPIKHTFCVIEGNYTHYFDDVTGPEQFGYALTAGTMFLDYNFLTAGLTGTKSESIDKTFNSNLLINKDFQYSKLSLAYGRKISRIATPYIQGFYTIHGKDAGKGYGVSLFVIFKLP